MGEKKKMQLWHSNLSPANLSMPPQFSEEFPWCFALAGCLGSACALSTFLLDE